MTQVFASAALSVQKIIGKMAAGVGAQGIPILLSM